MSKDTVDTGQPSSALGSHAYEQTTTGGEEKPSKKRIFDEVNGSGSSTDGVARRIYPRVADEPPTNGTEQPHDSAVQSASLDNSHQPTAAAAHLTVVPCKGERKDQLEEENVMELNLRDNSEERAHHELVALQVLNQQLLASPPTCTLPASIDAVRDGVASPQRDQELAQSLLGVLAQQQQQQQHAYTRNNATDHQQNMAQVRRTMSHQQQPSGSMASLGGMGNLGYSSMVQPNQTNVAMLREMLLVNQASLAYNGIPNNQIQEILHQMNSNNGAASSSMNQMLTTQASLASNAMSGSSAPVYRGEGNGQFASSQPFFNRQASMPVVDRGGVTPAAARMGINDAFLNQLLQRRPQGLQPQQQQLGLLQPSYNNHHQHVGGQSHPDNALLAHLLTSGSAGLSSNAGQSLGIPEQQFAVMQLWQQMQRGQPPLTDINSTQMQYNAALFNSLEASRHVASPVSLNSASLSSGNANSAQPVTSVTGTIPMESASDADHLSKYQVLVRRQLEYFVSQKDDAEYSVQGRKKQARLGQVGIRCKHCVHLPHRLRGRGAGYYPAKLAGVYQAAQNMATNHLNQFCNSIPADIRETLKSLRGGRHDSAAGGGKQYWADACVEIGLVEDEEDGLRFRNSRSASSRTA